MTETPQEHSRTGARAFYRQAWRVQHRWKNFMGYLFLVRSYPNGHWHVGFLNWFGVYAPSRRSWTFRNRPWPWATFGMPASAHRFFHFTVPTLWWS